jgi:hypothetical protein
MAYDDVDTSQIIGSFDLQMVDETSDEEIAARIAEEMRKPYLDGRHQYPATAYSFVLRNRPDMLKLHFRQMAELHAVPQVDDGDEPYWSLVVLTMLHWYSCNRVEHGVIHETRASHAFGASWAQVNEVFGLAFMHSGPSGFGSVYNAAFEYMLTYPRDEESTMRFPPGWEPDPEALHTGLDFSKPELSDSERQALFAWYEKTIGEVPRSVELLVQLNPRFAKAHRAKFERTFRGALPKQMLPYMLFHYEMNRGSVGGMREAALLCRAWGVSRDLMIHCVTLGTGYMAGLSAMYGVHDAIGELLDDWPS